MIRIITILHTFIHNVSDYQLFENHSNDITVDLDSRNTTKPRLRFNDSLSQQITIVFIPYHNLKVKIQLNLIHSLFFFLISSRAASNIALRKAQVSAAQCTRM